jgi:hypothetical protein
MKAAIEHDPNDLRNSWSRLDRRISWPDDGTGCTHLSTAANQRKGNVMDESSNDQDRDAYEAAKDVRARQRTLRGGHDPSELGRLSGQARREKARERALAVEHNELTVQARLAVAIAAELSYDELVQLIADLKERAHSGSGHVANGAAAQLLGLARVAIETGVEDEVDGHDIANMTSAQRATYRAALDKVIAEMEEGLGRGTPTGDETGL